MLRYMSSGAGCPATLGERRPSAMVLVASEGMGVESLMESASFQQATCHGGLSLRSRKIDRDEARFLDLFAGK
jgi:hypothetical protein